MNSTIDFANLNKKTAVKIFRKLVFILIIGLLGNILYTLWISNQSLWNCNVRFHLGFILLALILTLAPWLFHTWRIIIWTDFLGRRIPFRQALKIVLGTELGAAVSPSAIGGGPVKAAMLMQQHLSGGIATSLTALGSIEDNIAIFVLVPIGLTVSASWQLPAIWQVLYQLAPILLWAAAGIVGLGLSFLLLHRSREIIQLPALMLQMLDAPIVIRIKLGIYKFWNEFKSVYALIGQKGRKRLVGSLLITAVQWMCRYSVITALLWSMGIPANPFQMFAIQWIVFSLTVFIPTPGATAGAEAAYLLIHRTLIPEGMINVSMLAWRFFTFYLLIIVGIVLLILLNMPKPILPKMRRQPVVKPATLKAD